MATLNKVFLIGNLTRDPEFKVLESGTAVAKFGLAVNRNYTTASGEKREETTFIDVTAWGKQAEVIRQYMAKGRPIFVEGRLRLDSWTAQDGTKRNKIEVVLEGFQFLGPRQDGTGRVSRTEETEYQPANGSRVLVAAPVGGSGGSDALGLSEEEIPF